MLDASAILAYLQGERGSRVVEEHLNGAVLGAANLSEVLARFNSETEAALAHAILKAQGVVIEPVLTEDAVEAAALKSVKPQLSLGDRLCLALAERLDADVVTADRAWGSAGRIRQIRR